VNLVVHKGEMPFPVYYDAGRHAEINRWTMVDWRFPTRRGRQPGSRRWRQDGVDARDARDAAQVGPVLQKPIELCDWREHELREEELEGLERRMETPPIPLSQIGRRRHKSGAPLYDSILTGGW